MIIEQGMERMRDLISTDVTDGQLGSDGTAVETSDTGLGTAITGTDKTITKTNFYHGIKFEYATATGNGSGNTA